jgi:hypothetical protein
MISVSLAGGRGFGGDAAIDRLPKETLRRARRFLARVMAHQLAKRAGARLTGS